MPVNPLGVFLRGVDWSTCPDPFLILPGDSVLGVGGMERQLVMVEDVSLDSPFYRVNSRPAFETMAKKKLPNKSAAAEWT